MTERPPTTASVMRLAAPVMAQSLFETLNFVVDRAMLGRFDVEALGSMHVSSTLLWIIYTVLTASGAGSVALIGRAIGGKDPALAGATIRGSLVFVTCAGLVMAAFTEPVTALSLRVFAPELLEASGGVAGYVRDYLGVVLPGMPVFLLAWLAADSLQATGDTRTPFAAGVIANLLNIALNYALIFGHWGAPRLGAAGAAWATVAASAVQGILLLGWLGAGKAAAPLWGWGGEWAALRRVLRVSVGSFGERISQQSGYLIFIYLIGLLGPAAMAANQALISVEAFSFISAEAFGIGGSVLVAQKLGAGAPDHSQRGAQISTLLAVATLSGIGAIFVLIPEPLIAFFADDPALIRAGVPCLYIAALAQPFMAAAVVLGQSLRGAGATRSVFWVTALGGLVVRNLATYLFAIEWGLGLSGAWWGSTADWMVRALCLLWVFRRGGWKRLEV